MLNSKIEARLNKAVKAVNVARKLHERIPASKWESQSKNCFATNDRICQNFHYFAEEHADICKRNRADVPEGKTSVKMVTKAIREAIERILDVEDVLAEKKFYTETWSLNEKFNDMFDDVDEQREFRSILNDLSKCCDKGGKLTQAMVGVEVMQGGKLVTEDGKLVAA